MILDASGFVYVPAAPVGFARRVLIKPGASYPLPHPVTTSRETLSAVVEGIRQSGDADIYLLEGPEVEGSVREVYRQLGYDFPRVALVDVRDCVWVEVENPLQKPFALPSVWVPNLLLSCDYLISVSPFKILRHGGCFSLENLLGLLPPAKYRGDTGFSQEFLRRLGVANVVADLYFTIPFDLGVVDGRMKFVGLDSPTMGRADPCGKIIVGEPYEVDLQASRMAGVDTPYLRLIGEGKRSQLAAAASGV